MPIQFLRSILRIRPAVGLVTGADIMDGYYSPVMSLRMIIAADLLAKSGAKTSILGFSYNKRPPRSVVFAFRNLDRLVRINLRDPLSHERFERDSFRKANIVADTAFLLQPAAVLSETGRELAAWIEGERASGRKVMALNVHPMLFSPEQAANRLPKLLSATTSALHETVAGQQVSWVLLPHDDRAAAGDMSTLAKLHDVLDDETRRHTYFVSHPPSAAEIKAITALVDGVVTGRMHLAIASLGQGTPVMVFAYQDKFAGLLQHFSLPDWLVADADSACDAAFLQSLLGRFIDAVPELTLMVRARLPSVKALARANFEGLA